LRFIATLLTFTLQMLGLACRSDSEAQRVRPRQLRDVPAQRLAFTFTGGCRSAAECLCRRTKTIQAIQSDFDVRRKDEGLVLHRTVPSPDGQRALALYSEQDESSTTFHIDLYASSGSFIPQYDAAGFGSGLSGFRFVVSDSGSIAFVARKALSRKPARRRPVSNLLSHSKSPVATPTVMPAFPPSRLFRPSRSTSATRTVTD
jgi:hypothetical protein